MTNTAGERLQAGILAAKEGRLDQARQLLARVVKEDPDSESGWYWLGITLTSPETKADCFRRVLALNPEHHEARLQLDSLYWGDYATSGTTRPGLDRSGSPAAPVSGTGAGGPPQGAQSPFLDLGPEELPSTSPFVGEWAEDMPVASTSASEGARPFTRPLPPEQQSPEERLMQTLYSDELSRIKPVKPTRSARLEEEAPARKGLPLALWGMVALFILILVALGVVLLRKEGIVLW